MNPKFVIFDEMNDKMKYAFVCKTDKLHDTVFCTTYRDNMTHYEILSMAKERDCLTAGEYAVFMPTYYLNCKIFTIKEEKRLVVI